MFVLECSICERRAGPHDLLCSACGELLAYTLPTDIRQVPLLQTFAERRLSNDPRDLSGVWRYRELLPPLPEAMMTTLGENSVPIYTAQHGAAYAPLDRLTYLHLGMNPTGSFKDAGMTVAISHARARGARVAVCASTGNTAAAMAAYAARAGMTAVVLIPAGGISTAKLAQTLDYGARVIAIDGDFDQALEIVRTLDPVKVAIVNSINPYRIEGQKCAVLRLLELRNWQAPDWIVVPGGNLGNTSALGKGLREAHQLGIIDRLPRIAVVQASGAAPFVTVVRDGTTMQPVRANTTATAIKIGSPASWRKALREIEITHGTAVAVDDDQIADARAIIGRDGVGCEPASAATLAGLRLLRQHDVIAADEDVVLVLTGHVLKDGVYAATYHESAAPYANRTLSPTTPAEVTALIESLA